MDKGLMLLSMLRENARKGLTEISRKTGVPVSTIHERLKTLNSSHITRFTCLLDYESLGYSVRVNMLLKTKPEEKSDLGEYLCKTESINSIYKVNNGYDYIIEGIFKNIMELEEFSEKLDKKFSIKSKQVYYVIDDIKREGFLANPENAEILV
jgi:DNA-binding Lrp family transcriptional regulator